MLGQVCQVSDQGFLFCATKVVNNNTCAISECSRPDLCGGDKCLVINGNMTCTYMTPPPTSTTTTMSSTNSLSNCRANSCNNQPCLTINGVETCFCGPNYFGEFCEIILDHTTTGPIRATLTA